MLYEHFNKLYSVLMLEFSGACKPLHVNHMQLHLQLWSVNKWIGVFRINDVGSSTRIFEYSDLDTRTRIVLDRWVL